LSMVHRISGQRQAALEVLGSGYQIVYALSDFQEIIVKAVWKKKIDGWKVRDLSDFFSESSENRSWCSPLFSRYFLSVKNSKRGLQWMILRSRMLLVLKTIL
ncbi:MAG: hypothetical protein KJ630_11615, partial [Proteobacteria bacterium]|nr:hypothetical protein [Pseudomonadota bacterium]